MSGLKHWRIASDMVLCEPKRTTAADIKEALDAARRDALEEAAVLADVASAGLTTYARKHKPGSVVGIALDLQSLTVTTLADEIRKRKERPND